MFRSIGSIDVLTEAAAQSPDKIALITQALHFVEEPVYERALRHVLGMTPERCREWCARFEREQSISLQQAAE